MRVIGDCFDDAVIGCGLVWTIFFSYRHSEALYLFAQVILSHENIWSDIDMMINKERMKEK